jgi:hypothetical protein
MKLRRVNLAAIRTALPRIIRSALTQNLPYKGAALFLSIILWIMVERQTPRAQEAHVDVQLLLRMDSSLVRLSPLPEVRARIMVPAEGLLRLETERAQILKTFDTDVPDSVEITLRPRDVILPEGVIARVINVEPTSFIVRFDSMMQRTVPVRSELRLAPGNGVTIRGAPQFEPDSVTIIGRRQTIADIHSVSTEARDLVVRDSVAIRVRLVAPAPGVDVDPIDALVRVSIVRTDPP